MHKKQKHIYIGVDVHKKTHTACVINCWNEKLGEITVETTEAGYNNLLKYVLQFETEGVTDNVTAIYGLEDIQGFGRSLAIYLGDKDKPVKFVNSSLSDRKARKQAIRHKSDSHDALAIAKVLLEQLDSLPDSKVKNDTYYLINQLVSRRYRLTHDITMLSNQLHNLLSYHYHDYNNFFCRIILPTSLEFWYQYPSPQNLKHVTIEELGAFLGAHSRQQISIDKAKYILDSIVKHKTTLPICSTREFLIRSCVSEIKMKKQEAKELEKRLKVLVNSLPYKLDTLHGVSTTIAAKLLAEIGDIERFKTPAKLANYSGCAPITYASGQKTKHFASKQGNRKLHTIFFRLSLLQINKNPGNPIIYEYYQKKLKQGKTKRQAISCVSRRLVNIVYRMMKDKTEYRMVS